MRILIFGLNYAPELTGVGKYTGEMATWLASRGHTVRVVAAPPYYPAWKVREDYHGWPYRIERSASGPTVFRVPLWVPDRPNGWQRMLHLVSFLLGSLPVMLLQPFWKPDVVFTIEPTFFCAPVALLTASWSGACSWLHVQDFEVDAGFDLGLLPAGRLQRLALWLERLFTARFDRVSSISTKMVARLLSKGVPASKTVKFMNWVDTDAFYPLDRPSSYRAQLGLEGKVVLLYTGNFGGKQGLELLPPLAAALLDEPRAHLLLCGDGVHRVELERLVQGMPNVTMLPLQPVERLNELLNTADIHLLPQRVGAAELVMPSKLNGMLASGRPTITTADAGTQVAEIVEGRGLVVPTGDSAGLVAAARLLIADEGLRQRLGHAARTFAVEHLRRDQVLLQFEQDLESAVRRPGTAQAGALN